MLLERAQWTGTQANEPEYLGLNPALAFAVSVTLGTSITFFKLNFLIYQYLYPKVIVKIKWINTQLPLEILSIIINIQTVKRIR